MATKQEQQSMIPPPMFPAALPAEELQACMDGFLGLEGGRKQAQKDSIRNQVVGQISEHYGVSTIKRS